MGQENRIAGLLNGGGDSPRPSPAPGPSPTPPSAGTPPAPGPGGPSGGEVQNDAGAIEGIARTLDTTVQPKIEKARADIGALHLAETAFTAVTYALAIAYTEASAFMVQDLDSKVDKLGEYSHDLRTNAQVWREADQSSTVRTT